MQSEPRIETIAAKKLVGKRMRMSLTANTTSELFRSFMPFRKAIPHHVGTDVICMQVYDDLKSFTPDTLFDKWAAVEVSEWDAIPARMETYTLPGGMYAVFLYQGNPADFAPFFRYVFFEWLPQSAYEVDDRPHFDVLGAKYKNNDPTSEEEIWVPIRQRA